MNCVHILLRGPLAIVANVTSYLTVTVQTVVYRNICGASLRMKPTINHIDLMNTNAVTDTYLPRRVC